MHTRGIVASILLIMSLALCSCTPVVWEYPLAPVEKTEGDTRLPGAWGEKNKAVLWVGKPVEGWMSFAFLSDEQNKEFGKMYVSRLHGRTFLNIRMVEDGMLSPHYVILEYKIRGKKLFLWAPDKDYVQKEFETRMLPQSLEKIGDHVLLVHLSSEEVRDFIRRSPRDKLFEPLLDQPDHLIKLR